MVTATSQQAAQARRPLRVAPAWLYRLLDGAARFNELRRITPGITQRVLTTQLRELERDGVISRRVYPEVPPRVEYRLTEFGRSLAPLFTLLEQWGKKYRDARAGAG